MILLKFPIVYKCYGQRFVSRFRPFVICFQEHGVYLNVQSLDWELLQGPQVDGPQCRTTLRSSLNFPGSEGTTENLCVKHLAPFPAGMTSTLLALHPLRGPASILLSQQTYSPKNFETLYNIKTHWQKGSQTKIEFRNFFQKEAI